MSNSAFVKGSLATPVSVVNGGTAQTSYTNGQLLIGNTTGNTLAKATITQGGGVTVTNGTGSITLGVSALQTAWVPAAAIRPSSSGGSAALALVATGANQPDLSSLDFDQTTAEYAQFGVRFPKGWDQGTITAAFYWTANSTSTNSVIWGLQGVAVSDNDAIGAAYGTAQTVTDANGSSIYTLRASAATSAITIAGTPAVGDEVFFRVYRDAAAGGDTLAADALLLGVVLFYTITTIDDT